MAKNARSGTRRTVDGSSATAEQEKRLPSKTATAPTGSPGRKPEDHVAFGARLDDLHAPEDDEAEVLGGRALTEHLLTFS